MALVVCKQLFAADPTLFRAAVGDDDRNVPFSQTVDLVAALRKQGVEFEQLVFPDEVHGFLTHHSWIRAFQAAAEFLERRLMSTRHKVGDDPEQ